MREKRAGRKKGWILGAIVAIILALIVGIGIYNTPANRLRRQLDLGNKYLTGQKYAEAIVEFDKAIAIDPMCVDAYLGKAEAYIGIDNIDLAIETLEIGYELTQDAKILEKLEELRLLMKDDEEKIENSDKEDVVAESDEVAESDVEDEDQSESGLPYFELGFSPEDFTIAGYSVLDGNHIDDIEQAAAAVMPNDDDVKNNFDYVGWSYEWYFGRETDALGFNYYGDDCNYCPFNYDARFSSVSIGISGSYGEYDYPVSLNEFPLLTAKVLPGVDTTYENVLDTLGVRGLFEKANEMNSSGSDIKFEFESQYGKCFCAYTDGSEFGRDEYQIWFDSSRKNCFVGMTFENGSLSHITLHCPLDYGVTIIH